MFESIQSFLPLEWRRPFEFLAAPLWWIPEWQAAAVGFVFSGGTSGTVALKIIFLLLPVLLVLVALWTTMLAIYTVPFRANRQSFLTSLTLAWWDAGRSIWLFWAGMVRLAVMLVGWIWGLAVLFVRIIARGLRASFASPMRFMDWSTRRYFRPGVPWLAFVLTLAWSALEATIFTFTLSPTLTEVLADITGLAPTATVMLPVLWIFLFFLIAGSFACIQVMSEAFKARNAGRIVEMLFVEIFVMFFEVVFLYRELIDAITPWIAQQTGGQLQLGLFSTLALASFGWVGIRGMTWFLFGRYGTPALLAVLSRQSPTGEEQPPMAIPTQEPPVVWKSAMDALRAERAWFDAEARRLFEMLSLPVLQLFAAAINFPIVAVRSEPLFTLPFRNLDQALQAFPLAGRAHPTGDSSPRGTSSGPPSEGGMA